MVTTMRTMQRINNCRDMLSKVSCPRMRLMWKRNYDILLNKYSGDINETILTAARQVH
mgnify:CR=1 FL=1